MFTKVRGAATALLCAVALAVAGCGSGAGGDAPGDARTVATVKGEVRIPEAPKRVVLLNYALAGYLYDLRLPVVAMTPEFTGKPSEPNGAWAGDFRSAGTRFIPWPAEGFSIEEVAAQKPDLIVAGGIGLPFKQADDAYDKLSAIAPTVLVDKKYETWQAQFEYLAGAVFGKPQVYADAVRKYDEKIAEVKASITPPPAPAAFVSMTGKGVAHGLVEGRGVPGEFAKVGIASAPIFASGRFRPFSQGGDSYEVSPELIASTFDQPTLFVMAFNNASTASVATLRQQPVWAALPAFTANSAHDLPYWVQRPDFDRAIATLDLVRQMFPKR
ncbi:ABC transporter substrate-binding protein [Tsukamurella sp. 1534]|uniref:ABC transporter substrate-binding protein n=1 Tax=Tsukamurella sp. 1534 TaxID=1151061 RepID=UPI0003023BDB|nr:ABC transporter substrate-binding protein [Tsukamurella sp. 1534]